MSVESGKEEAGFEALGLEQLRLYARELRDHYQQERGLREKLEGWNRQLEQVVQEMTSMNATLRDRLEQRFALIYAYQDVLDRLDQLAREAGTAAERPAEQMRGEVRRLARELSGLATQARASARSEP